MEASRDVGRGRGVRVADLLQGAAALGVGGDGVGGQAIDDVDGVQDAPGVFGEGLAHVQLAVVAHHHHPVLGLDPLEHEAAQGVADPAPVGRPDVDVVDEDDEVEPLVVGQLSQDRHRRSLRRFLPGRGRRRLHRHAVGHGEEVGDLDRLAVVGDDEVLLGQTGHGAAVAVGHEDLDVDDVDLDDLEEGIDVGGLGRRLLGGERPPAQSEQHDGGGGSARAGGKAFLRHRISLPGLTARLLG